MKTSTITTFGLATVALLASALAKEAVTPCPTTTANTTTEPVYDEDLGCWAISVEHDATYCIDGPICSGSGLEPAGTLCPVKGDVATADCHSYLASYAGSDNCVLPVDATCEVIKTGAWGCVLSGTATPAPTTTTTSTTNSCDGEATPKPTKCTDEETTSAPTPAATPCAGGETKPPTPTKECTTGKCGETKPPTPTPTKCSSDKCDQPKTPTPPTPTPTHCTGNCSGGSGSFFGNDTYVGNYTTALAADTSAASTGGLSPGVIGAIAAAAAVVAVVAGAAIYKQYSKTLRDDDQERVRVVTP